MTAYHDANFFIDFLSLRGHAALLRTATSGGRTIDEMARDAEECLKLIQASHRGITSSHTLLEIENAALAAFRARASGLAHSEKFRLHSSKALITQAIMVARSFKIEVIDLQADALREAASNPFFDEEAVRFRDLLHLTVAIREGADLIISGDDDILRFDGLIRNRSGGPIRCLSSDRARLVL